MGLSNEAGIEGDLTKQWQSAIGIGNKAFGNGSIAIGNGSTANGESSVACGNANTVKVLHLQDATFAQ